MVIELIFNMIKSVVLMFLDMLPALEIITLPEGFLDWFGSVVSMSAYFLPIGDFLLMFGIWLAVANFHFIWNLIQRLWDALPFT